MTFYVLSLFPEMIGQGVGTSITGRAIRNHTIGLRTIDIRDFSADKHRRVDDYTYGGGAGMLMQPQPVYDAWKKAREEIAPGRKVRTIYVTPQGEPFTQKMAQRFALCDDLIFICGHYEGIDERVLEETVTDYVSIGDYVLTGGELAAMVMIDAISRLVPGVLHNTASAETESFHGSLLEYPQYSRPEEWHGKRVPEVLLSGNQKQVDAWRLIQQEKRTRERRPDLYEKYEELQNARKILLKNKIRCMDMIAGINCGHAEFPDSSLAGKEESRFILIRKPDTGEFAISDPLEEVEKRDRAFHRICREGGSGDRPLFTIDFHEEADAAAFAAFVEVQEEDDTLSISESEIFQQAVLTRREKLPVTGLYRPDGRPSQTGLVILPSEKKGTFEAFVNGISAGSITEGPDGCLEELFVKEEFRRQHVGMALETWLCNRILEEGMIPWCRYLENAACENLQKKLGLYCASVPVRRITCRKQAESLLQPTR